MDKVWKLSPEIFALNSESIIECYKDVKIDKWPDLAGLFPPIDCCVRINLQFIKKENLCPHEKTVPPPPSLHPLENPSYVIGIQITNGMDRVSNEEPNQLLDALWTGPVSPC